MTENLRRYTISNSNHQKIQIIIFRLISKPYNEIKTLYKNKPNNKQKDVESHHKKKKPQEWSICHYMFSQRRH